MTAHDSSSRPASPLRHPAEVPFFVFMVILNIAIVLAALRAAIVVPFLPAELQDSAFAEGVRAALIALLLLVPGLIVVREVQRATVRGSAAQLSERQYPEIYRMVEELASIQGLRRRPDIFLANGNGTLNAFAAQSSGHDYVVLTNELFANLHRENWAGLRFILGHEVGHIRLHHVSLWYQIAVAYSGRSPTLGALLSRLREYSCDRHGAATAPDGSTGLILLTSGRHTETDVDVDQLLHQGRGLRGFWVGLAVLPRSHPFSVRRLERLVGLGLLRPELQAPVASGVDRRPE